MKLIVTLLVSLGSVATFAANRPEPPRPETTRRASELPSTLVEKAEAASRTAREVLGVARVGRDFEIKLPEGLKENKFNRFERDLEEFTRILREKEQEFSRDTYKAAEVANFLQVLNQAYAQRGNLQQFLDNTSRLNEENKEVVQRFLDFIDNQVNIEVTVLTTEGLSQGQVIRALHPIVRMPTSRLNMENFIEVEAQITGILPKDYTMSKAARCVR